MIPTANVSPLAVSLPTLPKLYDQLSHELFVEVPRIYSRVVLEAPRENAAEQQQHGMSFGTATLTLLKAMVGPMLLFTPHMFAEAGAVFATFTFLLVSALSMLGMLRLVEVYEAIGGGRGGNDDQQQHHHTGGAYAEVGQRVLGRAGYLLVESCLVVSQWLYCVGYPIFVATNVQRVLATSGVSSFSSAPPSLAALTLLQLPVLVPYCWVREIRYLGYPMLLANVCLWGALLVVLYLVGSTLADTARGRSPPPSIDWGMRLGTGTLLFAGQAVVAFEGIAVVLPIRAAMREPRRFPRVLILCMALGTFTYVGTGLASYLAFGEHTQVFITLNLGGSSLASGVRAAFALSVVLTYPLQLFPAIQALEARLGLAAPPPPPSAGRAARRRLLGLQCLARTGLVCAAFAFALTAPYDNLVGLAGGLCAVPLAFIFPGWFHLRVCGPRHSAASRALDVFLVAFGVVMAPVAVGAAVLSWS